MDLFVSSTISLRIPSAYHKEISFCISFGSSCGNSNGNIFYNFFDNLCSVVPTMGSRAILICHDSKIQEMQVFRIGLLNQYNGVANVRDSLSSVMNHSSFSAQAVCQTRYLQVL